MNPKDAGSEEEASDENIRRVIEEIGKMRNQVRNSKLEREKPEYVFPSSKGKPFDSMTVHHTFHSALDRLGITDF